MAQFRGGRAQRPRGGRQETGYAAPAADYDYSAQPAYGDDQDVYQVRQQELQSVIILKLRNINMGLK